jgi:hypothetical protein
LAWTAIEDTKAHDKFADHLVEGCVSMLDRAARGGDRRREVFPPIPGRGMALAGAGAAIGVGAAMDLRR